MTHLEMANAFRRERDALADELAKRTIERDSYRGSWEVERRNCNLTAQAREKAEARVAALEAENARQRWALQCVMNVFGQDGLGDGAEGDTIAVVRECLQSETSAERCKHGVWAADRCEQCVAETDGAQK